MGMLSGSHGRNVAVHPPFSATHLERLAQAATQHACEHVAALGDFGVDRGRKAVVQRGEQRASGQGPTADAAAAAAAALGCLRRCCLEGYAKP